MLRVGLTGGIGCGKSSVAAMLRELECRVIEADPLAHRLTEPGQPAYEEVVRYFGRQVLRADQSLDRAKLAEIVFADYAKLYVLNEIVHPRVIAAVEQEFAELDRPGGPDVAVVEAALLVEANYRERLDRLVVVWCYPEQQLERLRQLGITREAALRRIESQMPVEEKRRAADDQIDNTGTLEATRKQVEALVARLKRPAA